MNIKKLLLIGGISIGAFFLYRKLAYAREVKKAPKPEVTEEELTSLEEEILSKTRKKISNLEKIIQEEAKEEEGKGPAPAIPLKQKEEKKKKKRICKRVKFYTIFPSGPLLMGQALVVKKRKKTKTICGRNINEIKDKAKSMKGTIFGYVPAKFVKFKILD